MQIRSLTSLCAVVIAASMILGGGTRAGLLSDVVLQLTGLPVLAMALWRSDQSAGGLVVGGKANGARDPAAVAALQQPSRGWLGALIWPSLLLLLAVLILLLQVVPWPGGIPGGAARLLPPNGADLASAGLPPMISRTVSVAPHLTWLALLSLITPAAVFFATAQLPAAARRQLTVVIIVIGVVSVVIGLGQLAQGPDSKLRFYEITNDREAVGLFANRNHFSALLYCLTLFAGAWVLEYARTLGQLPLGRRFETSVFLPSLAVVTVLVVLLAAQAMTRSRTGLGLTIVAIMGVFALALPDRRRIDAGGSFRAMSLIIGLALVFVGQFTLYGILERFGSDPMADPRVVFARNTMAAAQAYMPFGSGVGTFVPVYGMFEQRADALASAYVNRAHNEFLEIWLESGVFGIALLGLFLVWLLVRTVTVWRPAGGVSGAPGLPIDQSLARAATLVIILLIAHSTTDYPLRTGALLAVFAFAVAMLVPAPPDRDPAAVVVAAGAVVGGQAARRQSRHLPDVGASLAAVSAPPPVWSASPGAATARDLVAEPVTAAEAATPPRSRTKRMPPAPVVPVVNPVLTEAVWPDAWRQHSPVRTADPVKSWPTTPAMTRDAPATAAEPEPVKPNRHDRHDP